MTTGVVNGHRRVTTGVVNGPLAGTRTRAEHLSWASIPGTRALPPRIPRRVPLVRLAYAARPQRRPERPGDLGVAHEIAVPRRQVARPKPDWADRGLAKFVQLDGLIETPGTVCVKRELSVMKHWFSGALGPRTSRLGVSRRHHSNTLVGCLPGRPALPHGEAAMRSPLIAFTSRACAWIGATGLNQPAVPPRSLARHLPWPGRRASAVPGIFRSTTSVATSDSLRLKSRA